jgi:hypothetical protein
VFSLPPKSPKPAGNPYRILYWMGAGVLVLFIGIAALVMLRPKPGPTVKPDPERTLLWVYDRAAKSGPALGIILEESRSAGTLSAVAFPVPDGIRQVYANEGPRRAREAVQAELGRAIHHRLWLPYSVLTVLIDAASGVDVRGNRLSGAQAEKYIAEGGEGAPARATEVLLGLVDGVSRRGIDLSMRQALGLANQIDTDFDLTAMDQVFGDWSAYANPRVVAVATFDKAAILKALREDPPGPIK